MVFVISGVYVWEVRLQVCPFVQPGLLTKLIIIIIIIIIVEENMILSIT